MLVNKHRCLSRHILTNAMSRSAKSYHHAQQQQQYEVEMKFRFTVEQETRLKSLFKHQSTTTFTDEYFDTPLLFHLTQQDIWFRKRDSNFELKVPVYPFFTTSQEERTTAVDQYKELTHREDIVNFLTEFFTFNNKGDDCSVEDIIQSLPMLPFCKITTTRTRLIHERKNNEYHIDLDTTDDGYRIGEIEVMVDDLDEVGEASDRVKRFCQHYNLDTQGPIQGKVLRYIEMNNPMQHQVLDKCGLLKRKLRL